MPELPEVETVRRELAPWLTGRTVLQAERVDAPDGPKYAGLGRAAGARILSVNRRGKFLILPLSGGDELVIHLGMTGVLTPSAPERHLRVKLSLDDGPDPALFFKDARRFGRFLVVPSGDYRSLPTLAAIGPEPLSDTFNPEQFRTALARSGLPIKTYLLSQRPVAGVGNIYADEALWASRVHPLTPARDVPTSKVPALVRAIRDVLTASIRARGTTLSDYRTVNGEVGGYLSRLSAYGHAGAPCPRCGTPIAKFTLGGRGTHFCPTCQRLPRKRPA